MHPTARAAVGGASSSHVPGAVIIGYTSASCASGITGALRYNSATSTWNYCNGSAWTAVSTAASCPIGPLYSRNNDEGTCCDNNSGIWGDGTYIYMGQISAGGILWAYTFNETTHVWTLKSGTTTTTTGAVYGITGDGTYIYVAEGSSGLQAYTFNGTTFTLKGSYSTSMNAQALWYQGGYLFVADDTNGIKAFSFNGTTFTLKATNKPSGTEIDSIWGDGTTIYAGDSGAGKLRAYTFNGTAFAAGGTKSYAVNSIGGDGTYIYVGAAKTLYALTYNGSTFTQLASTSNYGDAYPMIVKNGYIYIGDISIRAYKFNGSAFTIKGNLPLNQAPASNEYFATNNFIYTTDQANSDEQFISAVPACQ